MYSANTQAYETYNLIPGMQNPIPEIPGLGSGPRTANTSYGIALKIKSFVLYL